MRKSLVASLLTLGLLAAGLHAREDKRLPRADKAPAKPTKEEKLPFFDAAAFIKEYDRNGDGYLSRDELPARFRHNFARIDTNKDGKISRAELEKGVAYLVPQRQPGDVVFLLVEMSDCDSCCCDELQRMYDLLRKIDKNGDGKIDAEELKAARETLLRERADGIIKDLDTNKDGKISKSEARGSVRRHFDEIDANKDGFIDRAELIKAMSALPPKLPPAGAKPPKKGS